MSTSSHSSDPTGVIRALRHRSGLTQAELAARCAISRRALVDLEAGRARPRWPTAIVLAAILDCKPSDLRGSDG